MAAKTNVYIDGFNLYNGAVRNTPYKWLDLGALCAALLPQATINRIRYFTARIVGFPHDPDAPTRQDVYLRALATIPNLTVHADGWFVSRPTLLPQFPLAILNPSRPPQMVQVRRIEEKRTDVDIATHLLCDCFDGDFDEAVVISNDSDLMLPIERVRLKYGKPIGVINPHPKSNRSGRLKTVASWQFRTINRSLLKKCQLPTPVRDATGKDIHKPATW